MFVTRLLFCHSADAANIRIQGLRQGRATSYVASTAAVLLHQEASTIAFTRERHGKSAVGWGEGLDRSHANLGGAGGQKGRCAPRSPPTQHAPRVGGSSSLQVLDLAIAMFFCSARGRLASITNVWLQLQVIAHTSSAAPPVENRCVL